MILLKGIPMSLKEARLLYLSCLAGIVLLLGILSYNVLLHADIDTSSLLGNHFDTLKSQSGPGNGAVSPVQNDPADLSGLKYSFIMPTYTADFPLAIAFLQSFMCLCDDYREIKIHVIVSDSSEQEQFRAALDGLQPCGERFSIFPVPPGNVGGPRPDVDVVNMFDIIPHVFHELTVGNVTADDTSALLRERGKYQYQTIKKLAGAASLDFDWALWIDSESIAVQPFSARRMFDAYVRAPTVWRSRNGFQTQMRDIMRRAAGVLRLPPDVFGPDSWNLESQQWFVEKAVVGDLFRHVEAAHGRDFWSVWAAAGGPFEINLYNLHVHWRKLETTDGLFAKYRIIDTEVEMRKYGVLAPETQQVMDGMKDTGLLERSFRFIRVPGISQKLSNMLKDYGVQIYRLDTVKDMAPEDVDRLLLDTPINMLCSAVPPLHKWWTEMNLKIG